MNKKVSSAGFLDMKFLSICLLVLLLSAFTVSQAASPPVQTPEETKQMIIQQVSQDWIAVGLTQYDRGLYEQSKKSFLQAQEYQAYLTATEMEKLGDCLKKIQTAFAERKIIAEHIQKADELTAKDELIKAKAHLKEIKNNEFLTKQEKQQVAGKLKKLDSRIADQAKDAAELYASSVEYYRAGEIEDAREGFIKVAGKGLLTLPQGQTAEDYLIKIDNALLAKARSSEPAETEIKQVEKTTPEPAKTLPIDSTVLSSSPTPIADPNDVAVIAVAEPSADNTSHTETDNSKKKILQSYTKAVINDAVTKAQNYLNQGAFNKAKEIVEAAEETLNKNQAELGDELFRQYNSQLQQLTERIGKERTRWLGAWDTKTAWKW